MTEEEIKLFDRGYNEGFFQAAQYVASEILRTVESRNDLLLPTHKRQLVALIKMDTKRILKKKQLVPYDYDVIIGKQEPVNIDFNCYL